ncbi:hypothetical protein Pelo_8775 [Pelomyxa schiedti]|nr:hypothetical protein Pelo_8775 [Pelomyxa schiedti]
MDFRDAFPFMGMGGFRTGGFSPEDFMNDEDDFRGAFSVDELRARKDILLHENFYNSFPDDFDDDDLD